MTQKSPSSDNRLALGYGSAWHLLRCLGWQRSWFTAQIARKVGASSIDWLDFPLHAGKQRYPSGTPIRDGEWKGVNFVDDPQIRQAYTKFWPNRGEPPNWDAIGRATVGGNLEWLLVEAKAHPAEISSRGTTASEASGRPKIRAAFIETLEALGNDTKSAASLAERWLTGYYQHANRLATLHFLTKQGLDAQLIFLYFYGDQHPRGKPRPDSAKIWIPLLEKIHDDLGLRGTTILEQRVHNIFVPVDPRYSSGHPPVSSLDSGHEPGLVETGTMT